MPTGIIIQIPSGSKKTYFIKHLSSSDKKKWLDGEKILKRAGINNKLDLWYNDNLDESINKINKIKKIFNLITKKGLNIFFSGNPLKMKTDVIVITDANERWKYHKLNKTNGKWAPSDGLFALEQQSYDKAAHIIPIVINGDIPNIKTLKSLNFHINFNEKLNNQFITK
jgi:hypothetical protein